MCWIAISPDSKNLYTSDAITDQIDVYSIAANPLSPVLVQTLSLAGTKNPANFDVTATFWDTTPFQLKTSPDGKFLFVINHEVSNPVGNTTGDALHVMKIGAGGMLTEVPTSPRYLSLEDGVPRNRISSGRSRFLKLPPLTVTARRNRDRGRRVVPAAPFTPCTAPFGRPRSASGWV